MFGHKNYSGEMNNLQQQDLAAAQQENQYRQMQMNIDATRRKRDIIRQAQVATAQAENTAANSGALKSSGIEGVRGAISGQAGVATMGVEWNQEIGNMMFGLDAQRNALRYQKSSLAAKSQQPQLADYASGFGSMVGQDRNDLYSFAKFAFSKL